MLGAGVAIPSCSGEGIGCGVVLPAFTFRLTRSLWDLSKFFSLSLFPHLSSGQQNRAWCRAGLLVGVGPQPSQAPALAALPLS